MKPTFAYDVFISYSQSDFSTVLDIAERLTRDGLRVWLDAWELKVGDNARQMKLKALEASRTLVFCMSGRTSASEWAELESSTFQFRDAFSQGRRFIPVRLDDSPIKESLSQFAYIDWRPRSLEQYERLLTACYSKYFSFAASLDIEQGNIRTLRLEGAMCVMPLPKSSEVLVGFSDGRIQRWDWSKQVMLAEVKSQTSVIYDLAVSPDGKRAVSSSNDGSVAFWDLDENRLVTLLQGPKAWVAGVAIGPDNKTVVSCSADGSVRVWDAEKGVLRKRLEGHTKSVLCVAFAGRDLVLTGGRDRKIRIWNIEAGCVMGILDGHLGSVTSVAATNDGSKGVSASLDGTVRIWDLKDFDNVAIIEGHTGPVNAATITKDQTRIISGSRDQICIWNMESGALEGVLQGHTQQISCVRASHDNRNVFSCSPDGTVRIWDLEAAVGVSSERVEPTRYTNAKILLVGESGTGKTGLAMRLTEDSFKPTASTDAAWASQLKLPSTNKEKSLGREMWLWDFAGQADYRLIHQLFMDETSLAILVFNPQSENPFEELGQWDYELQRSARGKFAKLLVAGRCDRGGLMVSRESIERFKRERGFADYIETSSLTGAGCQRLRDAILNQIAWDDIPWTASPSIFRSLKSEVLRLKDEGTVLLRTSELKQQLELRLQGKTFTIEELRAVLKLLAGPGVVWQLEFGDFVLLQPERINSYAAAVIRSVRGHRDEMGCISEEQILGGKLDYQDMKRLQPDDEQIVLRAMHQTFIDHGLCLREHTEKGTMLIFPSYFRRERPELDGHPIVLMSYEFSGPLAEIYATLVVRLHHTGSFDADRLWRYAADFKTAGGKRLGFKMKKKPEGTAELNIFFDSGVSEDTQVTFIRYVHEHLKAKAHNIRRFRHYVCLHCGTPVENQSVVEKRILAGKRDIICVACEERVDLKDLIEQRFASDELLSQVIELEQQADLAIDNESRELILVGHTFAITGEAGQIYRQYTNSDHGIDGEIEFKDADGKASGKRLYLQLKSGDSYLRKRKQDGEEIFTIKHERHAKYWKQQAYPVMLVVRTSDGIIRWMDISAYLRDGVNQRPEAALQIVFKGETLSALTIRRMRDRILLGQSKA
jgi:small GTP-binding protein